MTPSSQKLDWREEFEKEFSRGIMFGQSIGLTRKKLKSFIARVEAAAFQEGLNKSIEADEVLREEGRQEEQRLADKLL